MLLTSKIVEFLTKSSDQRERVPDIGAEAPIGRRPCRPMRKAIVLSMFALLSLTLAAGAASPDVSEEGFVPLFDGKSLDGWKMVDGDAVFRVAEGCIVAEVGSGKGAFLRTLKDDYRNFVLKLEVKMDEPCNSGVQFRSYQRDGNGQMCGYQFELDPSDRAWSGGIYFEGGRGWLFPLKDKEDARKAFKIGDWNECVVQAVGPRLQTWLNGVPCADLTDDVAKTGFFAVQMHPGEKGNIRWRNIRVKQLGNDK